EVDLEDVTGDERAGLTTQVHRQHHDPTTFAKLPSRFRTNSWRMLMSSRMALRAESALWNSKSPLTHARHDVASCVVLSRFADKTAPHAVSTPTGSRGTTGLPSSMMSCTRPRHLMRTSTYRAVITTRPPT